MSNCSNCGKEIEEKVIEIRDLNNNLICSDCLEKKVPNCICQYCKRPTSFEAIDDCCLCPRCQEKFDVYNTYAHNFGLIVPSKTGVLWQQQTRGVRCHHVLVQGTYVPLYKPRIWMEEEGVHRELLHELKSANYLSDVPNEEGKKLWLEIKEELSTDFEFEEVSRPDIRMPVTQEGLKWIKITETKSSRNWHNTSHLEGEIVGLVFPNCD